MERTCPDCGGSVKSDPACHTWPRTRDDDSIQWMACLPCDSATRWSCSAWQQEDFDDFEAGYIEEGDDGWGCGWSYTEGLNQGNPRSVENDSRRPSWL